MIFHKILFIYNYNILTYKIQDGDRWQRAMQETKEKQQGWLKEKAVKIPL